MSRQYFAVFTQMFRDPKYRKLTDSQRVTLLTLWGIAGDETPEATWRDREWLGRLLQLHERPADDVAALLEAGWLDRLDDGGTAVHGWDEWQMAGSKKVHDEWEAARKREWRRTQSKKSSRPDESESETRQDESESESERSPDAVRTPIPLPRNASFPDAWKAHGLGRPSRKQEDLLAELIDRHGHEQMCHWLDVKPPEVTSQSKVIEWLLGRAS